MARIVKVVLAAEVASYRSAMEQAASATAKVGGEGAKLAAARQMFDAFGRASVAAGTAVALGLGVAIAKFADFDAAMSNVAATGEDARQSIDALRDAALDAGARTVFSATEAANAIEELAKAGVSTTDILNGGLNGALDLAAAGGLGVADAAGIAATALQTFNLRGTDMAHVADLLAAGAGKAMGDVDDLSQALNQSALIANKTGLTIEETTAALSAFASQGLLGSDAGTSFKTMLLSLNPTSDKAADLMKELNLSAYDTSGQFIGLAAYAGKLESALGGMSAEQQNATLKTIFGNDAYRAAAVLLDEGEQGIKTWTAAVDDQGYAAEVAATKLDNLKGDVEAFQGALDSALISVGSAADGPLRGLVQGLTGLVDSFNALPEPAKQAAFWIGAVGSAAALGYGTYLLAIPKVAEYRASLELLGPTAQKTSRSLGMLAKVGGGAVAGFAIAGLGAELLINLLREMGPSAEETANKVATATSATKLLNAAFSEMGGANAKLAKLAIDNLGATLDKLKAGGQIKQGDILEVSSIEAVVRLGSELGKLAETDLPTAQRAFRTLTEESNLNVEQQTMLLEQMGPYRDALVEQATAQGVAADGQNLLRLALGESQKATADNESALRGLAGMADETANAVEDLSDTIRGFGSAQINVMEATAQFEQAFDDLTASVAENGATLDLAEQAGRSNQSALIAMAQASKELSASIYEQTGSQEEASAAIATGRQRLIEALAQLGITGQAAEDYANKLGLIPSNINTAVTANTDPAQQAIDRFIFANDGRRVNLYVDGVQGRQVAGTDVIARAGGGPVFGPGGPTSDSVPAWLSNGEHVWTAAEVQAAGGHKAVENMRNWVRGGGGGFSPSPAAAAPPSLNGVSIEGRLDLGDGLVGVVKGVLRQESADRSRRLEAGLAGV